MYVDYYEMSGCVGGDVRGRGNGGEDSVHGEL